MTVSIHERAASRTQFITGCYAEMLYKGFSLGISSLRYAKALLTEAVDDYSILGSQGMDKVIKEELNRVREFVKQYGSAEEFSKIPETTTHYQMHAAIFDHFRDKEKSAKEVPKPPKGFRANPHGLSSDAFKAADSIAMLAKAGKPRVSENPTLLLTER